MAEQRLEIDIQKKLKNFSLDIQFEAKSGCLGILGPSGCGKSMTLKSIAGIVRPDVGRIALCRDEARQGEAAKERKQERLLYDSAAHVDVRPQKRNVGYLFQSYALFPNMTVEQNIAAGLGSRARRSAPGGGAGANEVKRIVRDMVELFHLQGLQKQYPPQLSGGQQQRGALARILAYEPEVLLFDEPFSAMDTFLREGLRLELLKVLRRYEGISVLVTHDRDEAYQLCGRLLLMDSGKVLAAGETREVFANPRTVKAARLTGCKNLSKIERIASHRIRALDWGGIELVTEDEVTHAMTHAGIRAHDFKPVFAAEEKEGDNLIRVEDPAVSEMPFEWYITLKNGLWWKREKTIHTHDTSGWMPDYLYVPPSAILLLGDA